MLWARPGARGQKGYTGPAPGCYATPISLVRTGKGNNKDASDIFSIATAPAGERELLRVQVIVVARWWQALQAVVRAVLLLLFIGLALPRLVVLLLQAAGP